MNALMLVLGLLVGVVTPAAAQQDGKAAAAAVKAAELKRFAATTGRDYDALATLLSDDLVYTHSSASVDSKASYLESLRSGRVVYKEVTPSDLVVRMYGSTAVITGAAIIKTTSNGGEERTSNLRYTDVWVQQDGRWQMVSWQSTRVP